MDELLAEQVKQRTIDYAEFMPQDSRRQPSSSFSSSSSSSSFSSSSSSRLKILDDIDRIEIEQAVSAKTEPKVRFAEQVEEYAPA
jgi:hypothetical protein